MDVTGQPHPLIGLTSLARAGQGILAGCDQRIERACLGGGLAVQQLKTDPQGPRDCGSDARSGHRADVPADVAHQDRHDPERERGDHHRGDPRAKHVHG